MHIFSLLYLLGNQLKTLADIYIYVYIFVIAHIYSVYVDNHYCSCVSIIINKNIFKIFCPRTDRSQTDWRKIRDKI